MKKIKFKCELLSDVVIKSTSATQGISENLDYLPGSKFLGIVAKELYNENDIEKTNYIFHNGNIQFGDAHICLEGNRTYKVPASWFFAKGKGIDDKIYLYHNLSKEYKQQLSLEDIQLKQARDGYFTGDKYTNIESVFSIKSAYDTNKRKAKDSQMYGYNALEQGSIWEFTVTTKDKYSSEIISALEGKKRIGRSRSAEYGLVNISKVEENNIVNETIINPGEVFIYAESNLCFYDDFGQNTLQPTPKQLGFTESSEIIWNKSQIRTRKYQTWNNKRYNRDADRMIIEKGSVFVVKIEAPINTSRFSEGIGAHKNEGFGKVLINPDFLVSDSETIDLNLKRIDVTNQSKYLIKEGDRDNLLLDYLRAQQNKVSRILSVDKLINQFQKEHKSTFKGITASQWGQVRNYAKHAANEKALKDLLFADTIGYFMHGQSEHKWRENQRRDKLKSYLFGSNAKVQEGSRLEFVEKLAAEMGKNVKSKKQENE